LIWIYWNKEVIIKQQTIIEMKKIAYLVVFLANGLLFAQKIAYVQETKILYSLKEYQKQVKEIDSLSKQYKNQIAIKTTESNNKFDKLLAGYKFEQNETIESIKSKMKPADVKKLEALQSELAEIDSQGKKHENELSLIYKTKIQPKLDSVNKVIEDYAKKNKIDVIYKLENIGSALAYVNKKLEITDEIIKQLK
jgi:Skp family chaperone for outer membrane proteins